MKEELHQRLWGAMERWFELRESGVTKRDLKMAGLRERDDPYWATRQLVFTGNTRVTYERALKGFIDFCHGRGIERNADIDKRDMRDYMHHLMERGLSQSTLDKHRSACVKFGALYGKYDSFHAMSEKLGGEIRDLVQDGFIKGPAHQRITPEVADRALAHLNAAGSAHGLVAELQRMCGLRAIEATERLTPDRIVDGHVHVLGKGGRPRAIPVPADLASRITDYFTATGARCLAPLRAYETAWRRAVKNVGGRSTGTHALRRLWADEHRGARYRHYLDKGLDPASASEAAVADTLDALGHGRDRRELRSAYLRSA